jgi:predicted glycosyltransferase
MQLVSPTHRPTSRPPRGARFLFYTNECVGLGHLRRTLNLAEAVTARDPDSSALIITGSSAALGEERHDRIDIIKLPELARDAGGDLHAARLGMATNHLHELRAHLAFAAAETFAPSVVIVDKIPLGLNDELVPTLEALRAKRTKIVLGLRDIEDAPDAVRDRWVGANLREPINRLYDGVLVYGPEAGAQDALSCMGWDDLDVPIHHVGYVGAPVITRPAPDLATGYLLVTAGGGVDGAPVFDAVLSALEHQPTAYPTVMVTGPLMPAADRNRIADRAARLDVRHFDFRPDMGAVIAGARAVVTMAGYNTVAEVVRAGKPALLLPRTGPSQEQLVRAVTLCDAGVAMMLLPEHASALRMRSALDELSSRIPAPIDLAQHDGAQVAAEILCGMAREVWGNPVALEAVGAGR